MVRVILADDHEMVREGIRALLRNNKDICIVGEADSGHEVLELLEHQNADLVLMDINMPGLNGIKATEAIRKSHPDVKVLALSMHNDDAHIISMLEAGASGYILKASNKEILNKAIEEVSSNKTFFPPEVAQTVLQRHLKQKNPSGSQAALTPREKEVLYWIAEGLTNSEIAEKLFISKRTADAHRRNLLEKLNLKNTASLVRFAVEHGYTVL